MTGTFQGIILESKDPESWQVSPRVSFRIVSDGCPSDLNTGREEGRTVHLWRTNPTGVKGMVFSIVFLDTRLFSHGKGIIWRVASYVSLSIYLFLITLRWIFTTLSSYPSPVRRGRSPRRTFSFTVNSTHNFRSFLKQSTDSPSIYSHLDLLLRPSPTGLFSRHSSFPVSTNVRFWTYVLSTWKKTLTTRRPLTKVLPPTILM